MPLLRYCRVLLLGTLCAVSGNALAQAEQSYTTNGMLVQNYSESAASMSPAAYVSPSTGPMILRRDGSVFAAYRSPGSDFPISLKPLKQIVAGARVSVGLAVDGTVQMWGAVTQLPPANLRQVIQVDSDGYRFSALKQDGTVVLWGDWNQSMLPANLPRIKQIAGKYLLSEGGDVYQIGEPSPRSDVDPDHPTTEPSNFASISSVRGIGTAIRADGSGIFFGFPNPEGFQIRRLNPLPGIRWLAPHALGVGLTKDGHVYRDAEGSGWNQIGGGSGPVVAVDGNQEDPSSVWAVLENGVVRQLSGSDSEQPVNPLPTAPWLPVTDIAGFTPVLQNGGGARLLLDDGKIADAITGAPAGSIGPLSQFLVAQYFVVGLRPSGKVVTWGYFERPPTPVSDAVQIQVGPVGYHVLRRNGQVYYMDGTPVPTPNKITPLSQFGVSELGFVGLTRSGSVISWNREGSIAVPSGLANVVKVAAMDRRFLALQRDGKLVSWPGDDARVPGVADIYATAETLATQDDAGFWTVQIGSKSTLFRASKLAESYRLFFDRGLTVTYRSLIGLPEIRLGVSESSVLWGSTTVGTVTQRLPAPVGGSTITLNCDNSTVKVPTSVTIRPGEHSAKFPIQTGRFYDGPTGVGIVATKGTWSAKAQFLINRPFRMTLARNQLVTNSIWRTTTATIRQFNLAPAGGNTYSIRYSSPSVVGPTSVTIPTNKKECSFEVSAVGDLVTRVEIAVSRNGISDTASVVVEPLRIASTYATGSVRPGQKVSAGITYNAPLLETSKVRLDSSLPASIMPFDVVIEKGKSSGESTSAPVTYADGFRLVTLSNPTGFEKSVTVYGIHLSLTRGFGGQTVTSRVSIDWTPEADVTVTLKGDEAMVPSRVTIPKGSSSATFKVKLNSNAVVYSVEASIPYASSRATAEKQNASLTKIAFIPSTLVGGSDTNLILRLTIDADPNQDSQIELINFGGNTLEVPLSVLVPKGQKEFDIPVTHHAVTKQITLKVSASLNGPYKDALVTVKTK